jgi:hypothetical protein
MGRHRQNAAARASTRLQQEDLVPSASREQTGGVQAAEAGAEDGNAG